MSAISLVVCVYRECDLLERLLREAEGCYDDLIVVHDGPEHSDHGAAHNAGDLFSSWSDCKNPAQISLLESTIPPSEIARDYSVIEPNAPFPDGYRLKSGSPKQGSIHELVSKYGGRFIEGPRCFQQEPHWPLAWAQATHDWILRIDADEFPSIELKEWLMKFRLSVEPDSVISGYSCIWPLWDGKRTVTSKWPRGRNFLFHKQRVSFLGMVEEVPSADGLYQEIELILHHQPNRKSFGIKNIILRRQAYSWRRVIANSLLRKPTDLPRWRWYSANWPLVWEEIRTRPLTTALKRLILWTIRTAQDMHHAGEWPKLEACISGGLHHALICIQYWMIKNEQ